MKYLALLVIALSLISCAVNTSNYKVPENSRPCRYSHDCGRGEYCGFKGVDTYPVCKQ
jgi:hypothetical protein